MARPRALEPAPSLSLATPILCPQHAEERKAALKKLLRESHPGIAFNRHFDVEGSIVFHHACKLGCEGIVSKRLGSTYRGGRSADWTRSRIRRRPRCAGSRKKIGIARDPSLSLVPLVHMLSEIPALWRRCWSVNHKERGLLQSLNHLCLLQSPRTQRKGVAPRIVVKADLAGFVVHNNRIGDAP
jgi:hypothetical protein